jgi:hypothetical protein
VLTLDVDWAPDFVWRAVAEEVGRRGVRATWFVTHPSPVLEELRAAPDLHELGIHPNFLPGSTHGTEADDVLGHLLELVPEARCSRSHGLLQWGDLFRTLMACPIRIDSSTFLPGLAGIAPVHQWRAGESLLRIPFFFADDHELEKPDPGFELGAHLEVDGLKVFDFHPLHVYLNSSEPAQYAELKREAGDIRNATPELVDRYTNDGRGTKTLFLELLDYLAEAGGGRRLSDLDVAAATPAR